QTGRANSNGWLRRRGGRSPNTGSSRAKTRAAFACRAKQALVASRLCDYLAGSTFRPDDVAMPGTAALRLTDEVFLNFDQPKRARAGHSQIFVNRKDKA